MASESLREAGQAKDLLRRLPTDGRVAARDTVQVKSALGVKTPQGLHALVEGDEQGVPREEVPPRPGISQGSNRKAIAQGVDREGEVSCIEGDA